MANPITPVEHARRIVEALELLEWDGFYACSNPRCDQHKTIGHIPGCELSAALSSARELLSRLEGDAGDGAWRTALVGDVVEMLNGEQRLVHYVEPSEQGGVVISLDNGRRLVVPPIRAIHRPRFDFSTSPPGRASSDGGRQ